MTRRVSPPARVTSTAGALAALALLASGCAGAPAGDGGTPPLREAVIGRWVPLESYPTDPFIELADDGTWTGSDGCNGLGGTWDVDENGAVEASAGAQTMIGCEGENLGTLLVNAATIEVDGDEITFYDAEDAELGQAVRG